MEETPADRLRVAIGLHGLGVEMYRQRQRREHPEWEEKRVDAAVRDWLAAAPLDGPPSPPERLQRIRHLADSVALITERSFHRDRDLAAALAALRTSVS